MEPIKYVDELNAHYGSLGFPPYRWTINETAPLHLIEKPVSASVVSILASGGISQCSMPAFDPNARNDHRLDAIAEGEVIEVGQSVEVVDAYDNQIKVRAISDES